MSFTSSKSDVDLNKARRVIDETGLRYKVREPGTPFKTPYGSAIGGTMSCYYCGTHNDKSSRRSKKILGKNQSVCEPSCRKPKTPAHPCASAPTLESTE